uniref:Putative secreted protein n=1 Tax=Anopheles triannulatus TaxID=58253 RepID=A0A2M4B6F9_9DIPT
MFVLLFVALAMVDPLGFAPSTSDGCDARVMLPQFSLSLHVHVMRCVALSLCPGFAYCTVRGWRDSVVWVCVTIANQITPHLFSSLFLFRQASMGAIRAPFHIQ